MKIQISLYFFFKKNFRFASKEDVDQFLIWGKFRSTSKGDVDLFLFWRKRIVDMQIFENKKEITTIIKELRTCFDKIN